MKDNIRVGMAAALSVALAIVAPNGIAQSKAAKGATSTGSVQAYPTRPVRMIVASGAGGGLDFVARLVAPKITESLGQQILQLMENHPVADCRNRNQSGLAVASLGLEDLEERREPKAPFEALAGGVDEVLRPVCAELKAVDSVDTLACTLAELAPERHHERRSAHKFLISRFAVEGFLGGFLMKGQRMYAVLCVLKIEPDLRRGRGRG